MQNKSCFKLFSRAFFRTMLTSGTWPRLFAICVQIEVDREIVFSESVNHLSSVQIVSQGDDDKTRYFYNSFGHPCVVWNVSELMKEIQFAIQSVNLLLRGIYTPFSSSDWCISLIPSNPKWIIIKTCRQFPQIGKIH